MRRSQVETSGTCEWCPHGLVLLRSGTYWCPCEDCHPGGRIQGRTYPDSVTQVAATDQPGTYRGGHSEVGEPDTFTVPADEEVWVDPLHSI